ncbi:hypothetical protein [Natronospora cellulosivora (SeqCode)]
MLFKEIIDIRGLGEKNIKLVRHVVNRDYIKRIIENGDFELYQSYQKQNIFRDCDYIVTFTNLEGSKSLLKGLYKVYAIDEVNELPECINFIKEYESWGEGPYYKYYLKRENKLSDLEDRLIIDWGNSTRSWHQWLLEKEVLEILPI